MRHHLLIHLLLSFSFEIYCSSTDGIKSSGGPLTDPYDPLVHTLSRLYSDDISSRALSDLSRTTSALQRIDGLSYELYQRTKRETDVLKRSGRAERMLKRATCVMEGLFAAELIEYGIFYNKENESESGIGNGTVGEKEGRVPRRIQILHERGVSSIPVPKSDSKKIPLDLTILYEPSFSNDEGRIYIIITSPDGRDSKNDSLMVLSDADCVSHVKLKSGLISESAAVHKAIYASAGTIVARILKEEEGWAQISETEQSEKARENQDDEDEDHVERDQQIKIGPSVWKNVANVHVVGHGIAGGVAGLVGAMLEGSLPIPSHGKKSQGKKKRKKKRQTDDTGEDESDDPAGTAAALQGKITGMLLGPPPILSPLVACPFLSSVLYGDDILPRTSNRSMSRLYGRIQSSRSTGHKLLSAVGASWVSAAVSTSVDGIGKRVAGREGEEFRMSVPGKAFVVKPRRLDHGASMYEVEEGNVRAEVLWQLHDVPLSIKMWRHGTLDSYIHGLDRVMLGRGTKKMEEKEVEEEGESTDK